MGGGAVKRGRTQTHVKTLAGKTVKVTASEGQPCLCQSYHAGPPLGSVAWLNGEGEDTQT